MCENSHDTSCPCDNNDDYTQYCNAPTMAASTTDNKDAVTPVAEEGDAVAVAPAGAVVVGAAAPTAGPVDTGP